MTADLALRCLGFRLFWSCPKALCFSQDRRAAARVVLSQPQMQELLSYLEAQVRMYLGFIVCDPENVEHDEKLNVL